jgi:hypothetical protein
MLHKLASAAHMAHHLGHRFGAGESFGIVSGGIGEGYSVAGHLSRLLMPLIGPWGLGIAALTGIASGGAAIYQGFEKRKKAEERHAKEIARHLAHELAKRQGLELHEILREQAALAQLGARLGGVRVQ